MMFPGNGCCCDTPPPCRFMQVNALAYHGGYPGNEPPFIGTWTSVGSDNIGVINQMENATLVLLGLYNWPRIKTTSFVGCQEEKYLRLDIAGASTYVDGTVTRINVSWRGFMTWDRKSGLLETAEFYVDDGLGGGEVQVLSISLNLSTGAYTIVDNLPTENSPPENPLFYPAHYTAYAGGSATIVMDKENITYNYVIPDSGHGLGPDTCQMSITLSSKHDMTNAFDEAESLLGAVNLLDIDNGDSTGTYVPLEWNYEYNVAYSGWPIEPAVVSNEPCPAMIGPPLHFPPYVSKMYGGGFTTILASINRDYNMPTAPATTGDVTTPLGRIFIYSFHAPSFACYVSKLRAQTDSQRSALYSLEYQLCQCPPSDSDPMAFNCSSENYQLTGITDCDTGYSNETELNMSYGDVFFDYGISILFSECRTGTCATSTMAFGCEP